MVCDQIINYMWCDGVIRLYSYMRLTQNYKLRDLIGIFFFNFQEFIEKYAQIIGTIKFEGNFFSYTNTTLVFSSAT